MLGCARGFSPCNGMEPDEVAARYRVVFEDNFSFGAGTGPNQFKWNTRLPWGPTVTINGEEQYYTDTRLGDTSAPDPFAHDGNGHMVITAGLNDAQQQADTGKQFYSGVLTTFGSFFFRYGYVETRIKLPEDVQGLWSAFWLLNRFYQPDPRATGANGKYETEIDWEFVRGPGGAFQGGPYTTQCALGAYHYDDGQWKIDANGFAGRDANGAFTLPAASMQCDGTPLGTNTNPPTGFDPTCVPGDLADDFHTFAFWWKEDSIRWFLDGVEVFSVCDPLIVSQIYMYLILNQAVGGGFPGPADPADYADGSRMLIDYVCIAQDPVDIDNLQLRTEFLSLPAPPRFYIPDKRIIDPFARQRPRPVFV